MSILALIALGVIVFFLLKGTLRRLWLPLLVLVLVAALFSQGLFAYLLWVVIVAGAILLMVGKPFKRRSARRQ